LRQEHLKASSFLIGVVLDASGEELPNLGSGTLAEAAGYKAVRMRVDSIANSEEDVTIQRVSFCGEHMPCKGLSVAFNERRRPGRSSATVEEVLCWRGIFVQGTSSTGSSIFKANKISCGGH
jgi:hypothetical protein